MQFYVQRDDKNQRFVAKTDTGPLGYVGFTIEGSTAVFLATVVPPQYSRKGVADTLVSTGIKWAISEGYRLQANCAYIQHWFISHPEYNVYRISQAA